MLNYLWFGLAVIAIVVGAITGNLKEVTDAAVESAGKSVDIALGLIGIMAMWLGIMKIAEEAGLIRVLARVIRPISRRLFPDVPQDHPAMGMMLLNISANWLGLSNAATPLGIRAMEDLQTLNDKPDTATNAMVMFLALNTASITLIPISIIAVRQSLGSANPYEIIGPAVFSSSMATITAVIATKVLEKLGEGRLMQSLQAHSRGILVALGVVAGVVALVLTGALQPLLALLPPNFFRDAINFLSIVAIPVLIFLILSAGLWRKVKVYEVFVDGAKEGFEVAVKIIPFLVAILVAVGMFRASGAMDFFVAVVSPVTDLIGMPAEALPVAFTRPLTGSGTLGLATELMTTYGPDSFIGRLTSTMYGSTETTFYVIAVYFGAVGIKKTRHAVAAGLIADAAGLLAALFICKVVFG
jgi:spore maturation protein SpmA